MVVPPAQSDSATVTAEYTSMKQLVESLGGNQSAIARALSDGKPKGTEGHVTRQGLKKRLVRLGLDELANKLAIEGDVSGNRIEPPEVFAERRGHLLATLAGFATNNEALPSLNCSAMALYRKLSKYKITRDEVAAHRAARVAAAAAAAAAKPKRKRSKK